jgi:hypothetical protein
MSEMKEGGWEYFMKEFDPSDTATVELWLNHQGTSGWELVTVIPGLSKVLFCNGGCSYACHLHRIRLGQLANSHIAAPQIIH